MLRRCGTERGRIKSDPTGRADRVDAPIFLERWRGATGIAHGVGDDAVAKRVRGQCMY